MKLEIKKLIKYHMKNVKFYSARKKLVNKDFTIISNNCWGGHVYQDFNVEYCSPFVGLYMFAPDYLKLLKNFDYYMSQEFKTIEESKYDEVNDRRKDSYHPVGMLGDVEIQMLHYKTDEEAKDKWDRRKARMNWDNLYVKISERYGCTLDVLEEFHKLEFKNKISFTENNHESLKNSIYMDNFSMKNELNGYMKYFNTVKWLNDGIFEKY